MMQKFTSVLKLTLEVLGILRKYGEYLEALR
jgi:hypothetical protein